jgi:tetratricopeptide (TPR) repeat protein
MGGFRSSALALIAILGAMACAPKAPSTAPATAVHEGPDRREEVPVIVTTNEAIPVAELLSRAEASVLSGAFAEARRDFELLLRASHAPELQGRIHLGYARALEGEGLLPLAAEQLELRVSLVKDDERDRARMDWVACLLLLQQFEEAGALLGEVDPVRLDPASRVLLGAAKALSLVMKGEDAPAESALSPAWLAVEEGGAVMTPEMKRAAAWLSFADGEIEALRARSIRFDPVPSDVHGVLEARCRHMVAAQAGYAETMRLQAGRLRLLAGQRIAELYLGLHHDLVTAPLGSSVSEGTSQAAVARGALLMRYEVLLEKAEQMLRITLQGTPDTLAATAMRERLDAALLDVVERRTAARNAVDDLPVPRNDLARILESLGAPPTAPQPGPDEPRAPAAPPTAGHGGM